jgi:hypothetical protein
MNQRPARSKLVNTLTMIDGEVLERTPEREQHFWAKVQTFSRTFRRQGKR